MAGSSFWMILLLARPTFWVFYKLFYRHLTLSNNILVDNDKDLKVNNHFIMSFSKQSWCSSSFFGEFLQKYSSFIFCALRLGITRSSLRCRASKPLICKYWVDIKANQREVGIWSLFILGLKWLFLYIRRPFLQTPSLIFIS